MTLGGAEEGVVPDERDRAQVTDRCTGEFVQAWFTERWQVFFFVKIRYNSVAGAMDGPSPPSEDVPDYPFRRTSSYFRPPDIGA